ncbi:hypothetical protein [Paenarthrobacter sp. JL.01a]|uniref:hypothetical protein n=1 Tax=Paenarthrobacter sp. JL.01a TaxID=2979324 RepID=UPI0021C62B53|nr:hypothetical protein [Paenarthrobacter sp. JL.01a]UXM89868.1 hypothetical protein N5P29_11050 [Paenarthrobacter sp. JL.01a]
MRARYVTTMALTLGLLFWVSTIPGTVPRVASPPQPEPTATSVEPAAALHELPRIPWEGGTAYWRQFSKAFAAGWSDPSFFPIAIWYGSPGSDEQLKYDKALGINTYVQGNPDASSAAISAHGMFTLYTPTDAPSNWDRQVGSVLDDEVDGRYEPVAGLAHMKQLAAQHDPAQTGRFTYANWTSGILTYDVPMQFSTDYYSTANVNSVDQYFYSVPQCDWGEGTLRWRTPNGQNPITASNCRTASSYGKIMQLQQEINATRGVQAPLWALPTVVSTGGSTRGYKQLGPEQVKAQVWASVIHEARGIVWFSQSPDQQEVNDCITGDAFQDARKHSADCLKDQVAAVGVVNHAIAALAPVLNTQSYVWDFGEGTDTMLKAKDGSAYVFAMTDDGATGSRTFTLPGGITASTVEVLDENRSIPIQGGKFTDDFPNEYTHHVYRIAL